MFKYISTSRPACISVFHSTPIHLGAGMASYWSSPPTIHLLRCDYNHHHHHQQLVLLHPANSRCRYQPLTSINMLIRCSTDNTIATKTASKKTAGVSKRRSVQAPKIKTPKIAKNKPQEHQSNKVFDVRAMSQNGDPLGRRDLGKPVVKWISQGMKAMASDFATAEIQGEFSEVEQKMGPGLTFVIQSQPYLNAIPMPVGVEAVCFKACTHYPTLFDHFQRELRDALQKLQSESLVPTWSQTQSWKLLKKLATSGINQF